MIAYSPNQPRNPNNTHMIENKQTAVNHFKSLYRADREAATRNALDDSFNPTREYNSLADAISGAFGWHHSPETHGYWREVHDALVNGTYDVLRADQKRKEYFWHDENGEPAGLENISAELEREQPTNQCPTAAPLPEDAAERKTYPIFSGFINYFPNAIAAVSHLSYKGSQQHQPDQPTQWDMSKSGDELDALMRHMVDGEWEQVAWRAMANLERKLTGKCQYED